MPVPPSGSQPAMPSQPAAADPPELSVARRLRGLAEDPSNRAYIARKGVLPTLVKFLRHDQVVVQLTAAETLTMLSQHPEVPAVMVRDGDLVAELRQQLMTLSQSQPTCAEDTRLRRELESLRTTLRPHLPPEAVRELDPIAPDYGSYREPPPEAAYSRMPAMGGQHGPLPSELQSQYSRYPQEPSVLGARSAYPAVHRAYRREMAPRRADKRAQRPRRHLVVHCAGLTEDRIDDCEHLLRHVRGVVSYSMVGQELNIFASTATHALLMYLQETGFEPTLKEESMPAPTAAGDTAAAFHAERARQLVGKGPLRDHTERHKRDKHQKDKGLVSDFFQTLGKHLFS